MRPYYYSVNEYIRDTYGVKMYKLALNGGMTCPNRDGLIDTRGCIFCSAGGSGDFTGDALLKNMPSYVGTFRQGSYDTLSTADTADAADIQLWLDRQIDAAKSLVADKYHGDDYIAYFQAYTNTYAPVAYLEELFTTCIMRDDIRILDIATRPDCLSDEVLDLLNRLNCIKPVWVELGLQTVNPDSASFIRRGYSLDVYDKAVNNLKSRGIHTVVHMIAELPHETESDCLNTARYIAKSGANGIKIALLHVLKGTDLADYYLDGHFSVPDMDGYIRLLADIIEHLPPNMVVHRITGDGPKKLLLAPLWSADKKHVYNSIIKYFRDNNIRQGRLY